MSHSCWPKGLVVDGCLHVHEHLHIYLAEGDRNAEGTALEVVREWNGRIVGEIDGIEKSLSGFGKWLPRPHFAAATRRRSRWR